MVGGHCPSFLTQPRASFKIARTLPCFQRLTERKGCQGILRDTEATNDSMNGECLKMPASNGFDL